MATTQKLSLSNFRRRLVAGSFPEFRQLPDALRHMRFVQADPIRSPARAQDLILRQRVIGYVAGELERCFPKLKAEEGYLFAYGFMTPEVWRELRWRSHGKLSKLERAVLEAVRELGEVHPRGLDERFGRKSVQNYWGGKSKETKQALEKLHHHGHLRISRRERGIRIYQAPDDESVRNEDPAERYSRLALATAHVFGPTTQRFLTTELRSQNHLVQSRTERLAIIQSLVDSGQLIEFEVGGSTYLWRGDHWQSTSVPNRVRMLAPFDPLVRDRERFSQVWGWTYRFEAYVPAAKRQRGYYAMPVLWKDNVIGWANANMEDQRLKVDLGFAEKRPAAKAFRRLAEAEVDAMAVFLGLKSGDWELSIA